MLPAPPTLVGLAPVLRQMGLARRKPYQIPIPLRWWPMPNGQRTRCSNTHAKTPGQELSNTCDAAIHGGRLGKLTLDLVEIASAAVGYSRLGRRFARALL
jgi:hypothetical protein